MRPEAHRLHRAGILVEALGSLRQLVIPGLIGFTVSLGGGDGALGELARAGAWALALAALSVVMGFLSWRTTEYRLAEGSLRLRRGFVRVSETSVPVDRVQAVDSLRGPLQRVFGVVELRIQAAGGGRDAEIVLRAISLERAEEFNTAVLDFIAARTGAPA